MKEKEGDGAGPSRVYDNHKWTGDGYVLSWSWQSAYHICLYKDDWLGQNGRNKSSGVLIL